MHEQHEKKHGHDVAGKSAGVKESERRGTERLTFTASAEVVELGSGARFSTRTTDLGPGGCFVDTTIPFPVGSRLHLKLHKGKTSFETPGTVVYSQVGLGMGISFDDPKPEQRTAFASWLENVTGERHVSTDAAPQPAKVSTHQRGAEFAAIVRLVHLMVGKGILTEAEGASVLHDPVL